MRLGACCAIVLVGCASTHASAEKPPIPAPVAALPAMIEMRDDPGGDADFRDIANRAAADRSTAQVALQGFLFHHPHHPQRPLAVAMLAGVLLDRGDSATAKALLADNANILAGPDRDFLDGVTASQLGQHARALDLLKKYVSLDPARIPGLADAQARIILRPALAETLFASGDPAGAIDQLDLYAHLEGLGNPERGFARRRAEEIAKTMSDAAALEALASHHGGLTRAILGLGAVRALRARGDEPRAVELEADTAAERRQLGLEVDLPWAVAMDPTRFGLVVPLSGPQARLGEVVLRGATLVVVAAEHGSESVAYHLLPRDSAAPADRSALGGGSTAGVLALAREEKVIGVVATPDARGQEAATRDGLPMLLLDERAPGARTTAFPLIHSSEARAAALARRSLTLGARRFAILGPDSPSGKRLAAAFKQAVESGGGTLTVQATYAPTATTFSTEVASLRKMPFDALFIPDDANHLELVAPALAVADIWSRTPRSFSASAREAGTSGPGRRKILLLSTALGLSPKFLHNTERYVQGALLCPGYYPAEDERGGNFVSRFRDIYGTAPSATDAYGYDAVSVLRAAVDRGARTRGDVLRMLASQTFEGLTGDIRFGPEHNRIDPPLVYFVDGDSVHILK